MANYITKANYILNTLNRGDNRLSTQEACTSLARFAALLKQVDTKHKHQPLRLRKLQAVCAGFGFPWKAAANENGFLYVGRWITPYTADLIRWLHECRVPPPLRQRMATLLWKLGERHFPFGIRTTALGAYIAAEELEVLRWWRLLPDPADQEQALAHAEAELEAMPPAMLAAMGKHSAHAWISAALLDSAPFHRLAARILMPEDGAKKGMDPWQHAAATYCGPKPLLIEAGPGAGKTRTISARCVHILAEEVSKLQHAQMRAEDVVAVTFTNAAAKELKRRLDEMRLPRPTVSTMDKFCMSFLSGVVFRARGSLPPDQRRHSGIETVHLLPLTEARRKVALAKARREEETDEVNANATGRSLEEAMRAAFGNVYAASEALSCGVMALLSAMLRAYREHWLLSTSQPTDAAVDVIYDVIRSEWSFQQQQGLALALPAILVNPERDALAEADVNKARLKTLLGKFAARVADLGSPSFDFDKELLVLVLLQRRRPPKGTPDWVEHAAVKTAAVAMRALHAAKHFVIDELQDSNPSQLRVFAALATPSPGETRFSRLTMVGDCDQSIYGFRGARWATLDAEFFGADDVERLPLCKNYRSTAAIVAACTTLIEPNYRSGRLQQKELFAKRDSPAYPVRVIKCRDEAAEHEHVFAAIRSWYDANVRPSAIAVLFRNKPGVGGYENFINFLKEKNFLCYTLLSDASAEEEKALAGSDQQTQQTQVEAQPPSRCFSIGTIHAAKGKEWPIVFVVGLPLVVASQAERLLKARPGASLADWAAEERRCAYVAASRAACLLHVTYSTPPAPTPACAPLYNFVDGLRAAGTRFVQDIDFSQHATPAQVDEATRRLQPAPSVTLLDPDDETLPMQANATAADEEQDDEYQDDPMPGEEEEDDDEY